MHLMQFISFHFHVCIVDILSNLCDGWRHLHYSLVKNKSTNEMSRMQFVCIKPIKLALQISEVT